MLRIRACALDNSRHKHTKKLNLYASSGCDGCGVGWCRLHKLHAAQFASERGTCTITTGFYGINLSKTYCLGARTCNATTGTATTTTTAVRCARSDLLLARRASVSEYCEIVHAFAPHWRRRRRQPRHGSTHTHGPMTTMMTGAAAANEKCARQDNRELFITVMRCNALARAREMHQVCSISQNPGPVCRVSRLHRVCHS